MKQQSHFARAATPSAVLATTLVVLCACSGEIDSEPAMPGADGASSQGPSVTEPNPTSAVPNLAGAPNVVTGVVAEGQCDSSARVNPPLRLLNQEEYTNTVRDLFGVALDAQQRDPSGSAGISLAGSGTVSAARARELLVIAEGIADEFLPSLLNEGTCSAMDTSCAESLLATLGTRILRRPVSSAERERYLGFYVSSEAEHGGQAALRMMLASMLVSPEFLYRVERGEPTALADGSIPLTSYEVASRLSYLLRRSSPDEQLLAAAAAGELSDPAQVAAQASRLFERAATDGTLVPFFRQWLKVSSGAELSLVFEETESANAAVEHLGEFLGAWMQDPAGSFADLYTRPMNTTDTTGVPKTLRVGVLGDPALIASHTHNPDVAPIFRGKFALESLLCTEVPPPSFMPGVPEVEPGADVRETLAQHRENPSCAGCHNLLDPAGFPFQDLDEVGRYVPNADAVGALPELGEIKGLEALAEVVAASPSARECLVEHWLSYAFAQPSNELDRCAVVPLATSLEASPNAARALIEQTVQLPAFLTLPKENL